MIETVNQHKARSLYPKQSNRFSIERCQLTNEFILFSDSNSSPGDGMYPMMKSSMSGVSSRENFPSQEADICEANVQPIG